MDFVKYELDAGSDNVIEVTLNSQANVKLLDGANFQRYRQGKSHRFIGGLAKQSPIHLRAPHAGRWYVAIDLGGYGGTVRSSVRVL